MKKFNNYIVLQLLIIVITVPVFRIYSQEAGSGISDRDYEDVFNYLTMLEADTFVADVTTNIEIERDVGIFKLFNGKIYSCTPLGDRKTTVLFVGDGEFSFTPPTQIERDHLFRFYETDNIKKSFEYLFLVFADTTYGELSSKIKFEKEDIPWEVSNIIRDCKEYLINTDIGYAHSDFIRAFLEEETNELFYSQIGVEGESPVFFQISPYEEEEVCFMKRLKRGLIVTTNYHEVINQFRISDSVNKNQLSKDLVKNVIKIDKYKITSNITDGLDFSAECEINFHTMKPGYKWLNFYFYSELGVDSVCSETGERIYFYKGESNPELWIKLNEELVANKFYRLKIYYHGDLLEKNELAWVQLKSADYWYPRYGNREHEAYELIFHFPLDYKLLSIGEKESEYENEDEETITSKWICKYPVRNASFHIGKYEELKVTEEGFPEVNVYMSKYGHAEMSQKLLEYEILSSRDEQEDIGGDILNSARLFQTLFGKIPPKRLYVTEIPYYHGEAFPGLIHLSWITYQGINYDGSDEIFRAHEVAHQWWGINVDFKSYHDQWLSEGLSQYSGLMYLQAIMGDSELFFETLERWRDEIINNRSYLFITGQQAGPIWLGYRTNSSETEGDYNLIIYKKAAWVFHMLRNMLLNLQTMNEDVSQI